MSYLASAVFSLVDAFVLNNTTLATFSSAGGSLRQYPVNGNLDGGYAFAWNIVAVGLGTGVGEIRFNATTANQVAAQLGYSTTVPFVALEAGMGRASNQGGGVPGAVATGRVEFPLPATGNIRLSLLNRGAGTGVNRRTGVGGGAFNDAVSNIVSIDFNSNVNLVSGTIWLYVRNPQIPPMSRPT